MSDVKLLMVDSVPKILCPSDDPANMLSLNSSKMASDGVSRYESTSSRTTSRSLSISFSGNIELATRSDISSRQRAAFPFGNAEIHYCGFF